MDRAKFILFLANLLLVIGCNSDARTYKVSGTVTFEGNPVPDGDILLIPADGARGPIPGTIKDGEFLLYSVKGRMRVEILAVMEVPGENRRSNYIPSRYNTESTLTVEVSPTAVNHFEFDIKAQ